MVPLPFMSIGSTATIASVKGNDSTRKKILDLGIIPGEKIELFSANPGAPVVVKIQQNRIILDNSTSRRILVTP